LRVKIKTKTAAKRSGHVPKTEVRAEMKNWAAEALASVKRETDRNEVLVSEKRK
jgi:hypothetical protein